MAELERTVNLPTVPTDADPKKFYDFLVSLREAIAAMYDDVTRAINENTVAVTATNATYSATNVTTTRTYDADATSTDELADVLATLISDLHSRGLI